MAARITGSGAKDIAALLYAIMKDKTKTSGKTNLTNMLKSGKELKVFSVKQDELKKFTEEAKRYGVLYSALINKKNKSNDGIVDIMVRAEDAAKINRIVDRFKLSSYDEVSIRSEIEKTRESKNIGVEKEEKVIENTPIKREGEITNPHLAKTVKDPQSKPFSTMQKTSNQGTRQSVKKKLEYAKREAVKLEKSRNKEVIKTKEKNR